MPSPKYREIMRQIAPRGHATNSRDDSAWGALLESGQEGGERAGSASYVHLDRAVGEVAYGSAQPQAICLAPRPPAEADSLDTTFEHDSRPRVIIIWLHRPLDPSLARAVSRNRSRSVSAHVAGEDSSTAQPEDQSGDKCITT